MVEEFDDAFASFEYFLQRARIRMLQPPEGCGFWDRIGYIRSIWGDPCLQERSARVRGSNEEVEDRTRGQGVYAKLGLLAHFDSILLPRDVSV